MLNTNSAIAKLALGFHIFIVCSLQIIIALLAEEPSTKFQQPKTIFQFEERGSVSGKSRWPDPQTTSHELQPILTFPSLALPSNYDDS